MLAMLVPLISHSTHEYKLELQMGEDGPDAILTSQLPPELDSGLPTPLPNSGDPGSAYQVLAEDVQGPWACLCWCQDVHNNNKNPQELVLSIVWGR